jgi:hypothetical protein
MGMYALDDSRAAAVSAGRVEPFKDFCASRGESARLIQQIRSELADA